MISRWLRQPILHFVLIGMALFGLRALWPGDSARPPEAKREPVVITAARIEAMQSEFAQRYGRPPRPPELSALIGQAVDEELLYREARVLALDYEDGSVRRRLVEKMRAVGDRPGRSPDELVDEARQLGLAEDVVIRRLLIEKMRILLAEDPAAPPVTEQDLRDYLDRHRERFEQPAEISFFHVFLSESSRGARLERDAKALLARMRKLSPEAAAGLSDLFLLGLRIRAWSWNRVVARFGKPFAEAAFDLRPGLWSQPIPSPYGLHLVWVDENLPQRLPDFAAIRPQLLEAVRAERAAAQLARGMERLRGLYEVRVEGRGELPGAASVAVGL